MTEPKWGTIPMDISALSTMGASFKRALFMGCEHPNIPTTQLNYNRLELSHTFFILPFCQGNRAFGGHNHRYQALKGTHNSFLGGYC